MVQDQPPDSAFRLAADSDSENVRTVARLSRPRSPTPTTVAVISDPHVTPTGWGSWKVYHRTEQRFRTAIDDINRRSVDGVLLTGDLTKDGTVSEFRRVSALLEELDKPYVAIPGNHDVPKTFTDHTTPPLESFARQYSGGEIPFVRRIGGVDIVGLNTATATDGSLTDTHAGCLADRQLRWLTETLPELDCPIVALHHNLTRRAEADTPSSDPIWQLDNAVRLESILSEHGIELVLSGHTHCPAVGSFDGGREVVVPPTSSFPQAYSLVHIDGSGTEIRLVPLADSEGITEAWTHAFEANRGHLLDVATRGYPISDDREGQRQAWSPTVQD